MNKELALKMSCFLGLGDISNSNKLPDPLYEVDNTPLLNVLEEVFSVDPRTGFPQGDLAYYLSPEGNPQIKAWLENNLLKPRGINVSNGNYDDDTLVEFSRMPDETVSDYSKRLRGYYDDAVKIIESSKRKEV